MCPCSNNFGTQLKANKQNNNAYQNHKTALYSTAAHYANALLNKKNAQLKDFMPLFERMQ